MQEGRIWWWLSCHQWVQSRNVPWRTLAPSSLVCFHLPLGLVSSGFCKNKKARLKEEICHALLLKDFSLVSTPINEHEVVGSPITHKRLIFMFSLYSPNYYNFDLTVNTCFWCQYMYFSSFNSIGLANQVTLQSISIICSFLNV